MLVLGIESTCDETACAVVRDGNTILSSIVASQEVHASLGGVVPELASRHHVETCIPVLEEALKKAQVTLQEIDLIAVAKGPGLLGALLVGLNFAKGLALGLNKPFIGVNHIEAHLYSALMQQEVPMPALGVVISGGHTALLVIHALGHYQLVGETQDDAIGEAFDKVASLLNLPYPGGPEIETLAKEGNPHRFSLKAGQIKKRPHDFSFSGLKTGVLYLVKGQNALKGGALHISEEDKKDVAASFQKAALEDVVFKSLSAATAYGCKSLVVGGGVSNNQRLRELYQEHSSLPVFWPPKGLSLDNAAMIAGLGYWDYLKKQKSDPFDLEPLPRIPL